MIQENLKEEGIKRETLTEIDTEDTAIMRTIVIEEEEDVMSEGSITMMKISIQTQCPLNHHIPLTRGVGSTHRVRDAVATMSMIGAIVDMNVTEGMKDTEETAETITGTIMATSQGEEDTKGPEAAGMMSINTNLGAEESIGDMMITMTMTPILQIHLVNILQILIVVGDTQEDDAMAKEKRNV